MKANFLAAEAMGFSDYVRLESEKHLRLFQSRGHQRGFQGLRRKTAAGFSRSVKENPDMRLRQVALASNHLDEVVGGVGATCSD